MLTNALEPIGLKARPVLLGSHRNVGLFCDCTDIVAKSDLGSVVMPAEDIFDIEAATIATKTEKYIFAGALANSREIIQFNVVACLGL